MLGPLAFERDGAEVRLPSGHQRSLLALLLMAGGVPLSRDRLIDELWGERPPASAVSALHVHLSKLRGLLDGLLVLEAAGYALETGSFELDAWRFDELIEQARGDPERAGVLLGEALALVRGGPLCDVACEGSIAQWRRSLEEKWLQATTLRIDTDLAAGAAGELVAELERLVDQHPFDERLWAQLMLALHRAGRQADALDTYTRARRRFAEELGLEPGEQLTGLQQRILERDPTLLPRADTPLVAGSQASSLPRPMTRLVGRENELTALARLLDDPDVRLVTLAGPGGVGKTRLLLELARQQEPSYAEGAAFVRLERLTDPALVATEIASTLGQRDGTDGASPDGLVSFLRNHEMLVAIDNFEHLLPAATLVAELLGETAGIRVLVSSRTALRIRGEHVFEVEPLELPADDSDAEVSRSPAVQLFLHRALAVNRRLEVDADVMRTVAAICKALDGLPLGIELAASRSQSLHPSEIEEQLARPLSIGEYALRDLPERQQSLEAAISWSYDLLTPRAEETLRAAAVFLGGFTLDVLEAITGRPSRLQLDELVDSSLVRRQAIEGRFELLELVRAFALEELQRVGLASEARTRWRRYFAERVASADEKFDAGGAPGDLAAPLLADHANLRAALEDAIEAGDQESSISLALGLRPLWIAGMLRQECQELVRRLLDRFAVLAASEIALLRAAAFLDYSPAAKTWNRRLAACAAAAGDQEALATATGNLFGQALNARDREEMKRLRPTLLGLITPDTSTKALGWIHYFLALDAYVEGSFQSASEHAALSAEHAKASGHEFMLGTAAGTQLLAESARDGAIPQPALMETLELMRRPGVQPLVAFALWFVARYAAGVDPATAGRFLAHAERILAAIDSELWPESLLREESLAVLDIDDFAPLLERTPPLDHVAALAEAATWLAERDPDELAPREGARQFVSTSS